MSSLRKSGFAQSRKDPQKTQSKETTMTISVFVGTSVDGFIARRNDDLDFLPVGGGEPHGYNELTTFQTRHSFRSAFSTQVGDLCNNELKAVNPSIC